MSPLNQLEPPMCVQETMLCDTIPLKIGDDSVNNDIVKPIAVKSDDETKIKNDINILKSSFIPHPPKYSPSNGVSYDSQKQNDGPKNDFKSTKFLNEDSAAKLKSMLESNERKQTHTRKRKTSDQKALRV